MVLKLRAAVTGGGASRAESCWHVASTLRGEYSSPGTQGGCVGAFGAAVAVLMAMICRNERIAVAVAVAVELSCWI